MEAQSIESINISTGNTYKSKKNETGGLIGTIFIFLSILLCVTYLIAVFVQKKNLDSIKITTIVCWTIFGIFFSYIIFVNNDVRMNIGIFIFVILISCLITCRQINVIKTCVI